MPVCLLREPPRPRPLRCELLIHRAQCVKAAQEGGLKSGGALVLALIYGERVLLLSPKILYNWLMELLPQVER
jgi:hypothetical protein